MPLSLYAKDKVAIEKYILGFKFKTKTEVIILRLQLLSVYLIE